MPAQTSAATAAAADNNNTSSNAGAGATKSSSGVGPTTNSTAASTNRAMEASEKRNNAVPKQKNMEAEAAIKIQAGFRGYQVRKQLKNKSNGAQSDPDDDVVVVDNQTETASVILAKDWSPDDAQKHVAKQRKDGMLDEVTEDNKLVGSKTGCSAGDSVISANQTRRSSRRKSNTKTKPVELEEKSAVKIQAGVRGFLVRRRQQKKQKQPKE